MNLRDFGLLLLLAIIKVLKDYNPSIDLWIVVGIGFVLFYMYISKKQVIEGFDWDDVNFEFDFIKEPRISHKDKFYIKTIDGKYLTSCSWCIPIDANIENKCTRVLCLTDVPYRSSQFMYHRHRDGTFSLETFDFKWLKRCSQCLHGCDHIICADGLNPTLQTHKFVLIKNRDGTVSIKTDNDRLMEVTECNQTCGRVITAMGLNHHTTRFNLEMLPKEKLDPRIYETPDDGKGPRFEIPLPFPYQFNFNHR